MENIVQILLEIVKYTIPALIVFLTVYFMLKSHFKHQYNIEILKYNSQKNKRSLPLKLQAYERLALFLERIDIPKLMMRLQANGMTSRELEGALIVSIQKEYEHNLAQQIYISEQLWQIISLAKDQVLTTVTNAASKIPSDASSAEFSNQLFQDFGTQEINPIQKALTAINKEIKLLL